MIPALKKFIANDKAGQLLVLKKVFPDIVESSLKYLGKKEQKKYAELIKE